MTDKITQAIRQALLELGLTPAKIELEHPADEKFGDWSSNVALQVIKQTDLFETPLELAKALAGKLEISLKGESGIEKISVAGPGFINFSLSQAYWLDQLTSLNKNTDLLSLTPLPGQGKQAIFEYSSPNIAKPFTVGHLRSTIIGDALANIYENLGWQVFRDNHLGDWGTQFGKLIYAIKEWGDKEAIGKAERPIKKLVELYVKFHQEAEKNPSLNDFGREWFAKLENGDVEARELWQWCVDLSWLEFDKIYEELKITFTENNGRGYGESFFEEYMPEVISILEKKLPENEFTKNGGYYGEGEDGARLVFFKDEALPSLMIQKKDGATLYATRDLATDYFRLKNYDSPTLVVNEVGAEQSLYFKQLYKVEEMLGWYQPGQRVHVRHGLYRFKDKKMSTRKGDVIWLEDVIEEAKQRALKLAPDKPAVADQVAIGALKWNDLKSETTRDITFSWDEILSMKGNSGPYVQYAAVRANSVLAKAKTRQVMPGNYTFNQEELVLVRHLSRFGEAVVEAAVEFAPHHLSLYLFELAQRFNTFYNQHPILTAAKGEEQAVRLGLTQTTQLILSAGLQLLGIETPEEM